jgi:hypothetical protein
MSSYEWYQLKLQCYIQAKEAAEAYVRECKPSNFESKDTLSADHIIREAEKIYIFVTKQ